MFLIIIIIVLNLFDKTKYKIILLSIVVICFFIFIVLNGGVDPEYEAYKTLDNYGINFVGKIEVSFYTKTAKGKVEIINSTDNIHSIKINGKHKGKYNFKVTDEAKNEYYYDQDTKSVILNRK